MAHFVVSLRHDGGVIVAGDLANAADADGLISALTFARGFLPAAPSPEFIEFSDFMAAGDRKIHAIKAARAAYDIGLKEAKDLVEEIERGIRPMPSATEFARKIIPPINRFVEPAPIHPVNGHTAA